MIAWPEGNDVPARETVRLIQSGIEGWRLLGLEIRDGALVITIAPRTTNNLHHATMT
jgi:hypothetical protein